MELEVSQSFLLGVSLFLSNTAGAEDKEPPNLKHESIGEAPLYEPILFDVLIQDISGVFAPSVYYRYAGQADYRVIELTRKGANFTAQISGSEVTGDIEYFIEAFDEQGNGPSRLGSPNQPFRIAVGKNDAGNSFAAPREKGSRYTRSTRS